MKGDFSRMRFNPRKQYTAVLQQQGRVALDADSNEQCAIDARLRETANIDIVGRYGGPVGNAGFALEIVGTDIFILPGRYYVDGLLVEIADKTSYDSQPYLLSPSQRAADLLKAVKQGKGSVTAQFQLEVWQRLATALDDSCLREPALGQADTTARLQTVWRVRGTIQNAPTGNVAKASLSVLATSSVPDPVSKLSPCCQVMYQGPKLLRTGGMGADTSGAGNDCGCQPVAAAGFQGLENQLYRVEIHQGGTLDTATFKWSRENGSVVSRITDVSGPVVTLDSLGPDANLGYQVGEWVEISDDSELFGDFPNQPGSLYQILSIQPASLQVTLGAAPTGIDPSRNARLRRWEQSGASATAAGVPLSGAPVPLENGIEVSFRTGVYQPGDYWTIPARTATGAVEWPPCGSDGSFFQPPQFAKVRMAPVACVHLRSSTPVNQNSNRLHLVTNLFVVDDCRLLFPPLTALSAGTATTAIHVKSASWTNDDVMTVDTLLEQGLSVTFDHATTCAWGGGNFKVSLEPPLANDPVGFYQDAISAMKAAGKVVSGTDVFLRTVLALDPPQGIVVSGNTVQWLPPAARTGVQMYSAYWLFVTLNTLLVASKTTGFGRVRIQLIGSAVFGSGTSGNIYLDGATPGVAATMSNDGSPSVGLSFPSGNAERSSDFESWFYLAPTVLIAGVSIQGTENGNVVPVNAVTVEVDSHGAMTGLQNTLGAAPIAVTALHAVVTLTYPPIADTTVTLALSGSGVGSVVTVAASVVVPKGQISVTVPIQVQSSPGPQVTDTVTLSASVATAVGNFPWNQPPSLAITGGIVPIVIY